MTRRQLIKLETELADRIAKSLGITIISPEETKQQRYQAKAELGPTPQQYQREKEKERARAKYRAAEEVWPEELQISKQLHTLALDGREKLPLIEALYLYRVLEKVPIKDEGIRSILLKDIKTRLKAAGSFIARMARTYFQEDFVRSSVDYKAKQFFPSDPGLQSTFRLRFMAAQNVPLSNFFNYFNLVLRMLDGHSGAKLFLYSVSALYSLPRINRELTESDVKAWFDQLLDLTKYNDDDGRPLLGWERVQPGWVGMLLRLDLSSLRAKYQGHIRDVINQADHLLQNQPTP